MLVAHERAVRRYGLTPLARVTSGATVGVPPRLMGIGPVASTRKLLGRNGLQVGDIAVVELNEAFAAQSLAVLRELELPDDAEHVNPNGGAIALGHPLGASGARLALTAAMTCGAAAHGVPSPPCASASVRAFRSCSNPPDTDKRTDTRRDRHDHSDVTPPGRRDKRARPRLPEPGSRPISLETDQTPDGQAWWLPTGSGWLAPADQLRQTGEHHRRGNRDRPEGGAGDDRYLQRRALMRHLVAWRSIGF